MNSRQLEPSLDFLQSASERSLQSFELSRLNHANNLRREIATLLDEWLRETVDALLARWLLNQRRRPQTTHGRAKSLGHSHCAVGPPQLAPPCALIGLADSIFGLFLSVFLPALGNRPPPLRLFHTRFPQSRSSSGHSRFPSSNTQWKRKEMERIASQLSRFASGTPALHSPLHLHAEPLKSRHVPAQLRRCVPRCNPALVLPAGI